MIEVVDLVIFSCGLSTVCWTVDVGSETDLKFNIKSIVWDDFGSETELQFNSKSIVWDDFLKWQ